jgi:hypothetical protein
VQGRRHVEPPASRDRLPTKGQGIIDTIFVGLMVGALARLVLPSDQKMGGPSLACSAIAGSLLARFVEVSEE